MTDVAAGSWSAAPRSRRRIKIRFKSADVAGLYEQYSAPLLGYLRAQGAPDPEHALGEVFYQVARDLRQFSGSRTDERRWVFGIARARMIDARRRRPTRPPLADRAQPHPEATGRRDTGMDDELVAALAGVADEQREVIALRLVADLSIRDVAAVTGRDVRSVKELEQQGLSSLRQVLADGVPDPAAN